MARFLLILGLPLSTVAIAKWENADGKLGTISIAKDNVDERIHKASFLIQRLSYPTETVLSSSRPKAESWVEKMDKKELHVLCEGVR